MNEHLRTILNCFSGLDGGVSFVKLRLIVESLQNRDDEASIKIMEIIRQFANLVRYAENFDIGNNNGTN